MNSSLADIINVVDTLLNTPRIGWIQRGVSGGTAETVGDHTLLTSYLALIICNSVKGAGINLDLGKCIIMALIHDAHEALMGNVGNNVRSMISNWRDLEVQVFRSLGFPDYLNDYFREYRYESSVEGKVVNLADKLATYMRACFYSMIGYDTSELINNYQELISKIMSELPPEITRAIQGIITPLLSEDYCLNIRRVRHD